MSSSFITNSDHQINLNYGANTLTVVGNLSVTGTTNIGGNVSFNTILNGNSNVSIPVSNGNVNVSAASQTWVFNTTGNLVFPTGMQIGFEGANTKISQSSNWLKMAAANTATMIIGWSQTENAPYGNVAQIVANDGGPVYSSNLIVRTGNISASPYVWVFANNGQLTTPGAVLANGIVKTGVFVASTIPTASSVGAGSRAFVTDADSVTFANLYVGGSGNSMPVWSNGTNWYVG
jgi:hypothetical protein